MDILFNQAKIFEFNDLGKKDPQVENIISGYSNVDIFKILLKNKSKLYRRHGESKYKLTENNVKILSSTMKNNAVITHSNLIQYIYNCWGKEKGIVLKPDMFFFTIVSEVKNHILSNSDKFKDLFTGSNEKVKIEIVNLTIDDLMNEIRRNMKSTELFDSIVQFNLPSISENFQQTMAITMADCGTAYFEYFSTMCGIPKIAIVGNQNEWFQFLKIISDLKDILLGKCEKLDSYMNIVLENLINLHIAIKNDNAEYFKDIFSYGKNPNCQSGHSKVVIDGWITNYYMDKNNYDYINHYPSHLSCLPYKQEYASSYGYRFYVAGMINSMEYNDFYVPQYDIIHYEIVGENALEIYNLISKN